MNILCKLIIISLIAKCASSEIVFKNDEALTSTTENSESAAADTSSSPISTSETTSSTSSPTTSISSTTSTVSTTTQSPCLGVPALQHVKTHRTNSEILVNWLPAKNQAHCKLQYVLGIQKLNGVTTRNLLGNVHNYTFEKLESCASYTVTISPKNDEHYGAPIAKKITTLPDPVHRFELDVITPNMIHLSWESSKNRCNKYNVYFEESILVAHIRMNYYSLRRNNIYCKRLGVQTVSEENLKGEIVYGQVAGKVKNLSSNRQGDNVTLTWDPPDDDSCLLGYRVKRNKESSLYTKETSFTFSASMPNSCYSNNIQVATLSESNHLGDAVELTYKEDDVSSDEIGQVVDFDVTEDNGILKASWRPPTNLESCDIIYKLQCNENDEKTNDTEITFGKVVACKIYELSIRPFIAEKEGSASTKTYTGKVSVVEEVQNIAYSEEDEHLVITWEAPIGLENCNLNYTITINEEDHSTTETRIKFQFPVIPCKMYTGTIRANFEDITGQDSMLTHKGDAKAVPAPKFQDSKSSTKSLELIYAIDNSNENMCKAQTLYVTCLALDQESNRECVQYSGYSKTSVEDGQDKVSITVNQLSAYTNYTCAATVENVAGNSSETKDKFATLPDVPPSPINIRITDVTTTNATIEWDMPECVFGLVEEFRITVNLEETLHFIPSFCEPPSYSNSSTTSTNNYFFEDGIPDANYSVSITALSNGGESRANEAFINTKIGVSDDILDRQLNCNEDLNDITFKLWWKHPCNTNGPIQDFVIKLTGKSYAEDSSDIRNFTEISNYDDYNVTITDIKPAFTYNLKIYPDDSAHSLTNISCKTLQGIPEKPRDLTLASVSAEAFTLVWEPPEVINGFLENYIVSVKDDGPQYKVNCNITNSDKSTEVKETNFDFFLAKPYFKYISSVKAQTSRGAGPEVTYTVITNSTYPEHVRNLSSKISNENGKEMYNAVAIISYDKPCFTHGDLDDYTVTFRGVRNADIHYESDTTYECEYSFELKPEFDYKVWVEVRNKQGYISEQALIGFSSPPGIPAKIETSHLSGPRKAGDDPYVLDFTLSKSLFDDDSGQILYYAIILTTSESDGNSYGTWDTTCAPNAITSILWNPFNGTNLNFYTYKIGTGEVGCGKAKNVLEPDTKYFLTIRGFTSATYRDSPAIQFITEKLKYNLVLIISVTFGVIITLLLFMFIFVKLKNRNDKKIDGFEKKDDISLELPRNIPIEQIPAYHANLKKNPFRLKAEYSELASEPGSTACATLAINKKKNRYVDILPYDDTRVILKQKDDSNDYINATYIKGYSGNIEYIASQGPLATTTADFWKLVIQENVTLIVMLTQFVEANKIKCHQYIPNNHENMEIDEEIEIRCSNELNFGSYCSRTLLVQKDTSKWTVQHLQYTDWPDFGCPKETKSLLQFCKIMRDFMKKSDGLVLIHCSAGVGRTGTLIALDILLQTMNDNKVLNVFQTVFNLRKQRMKMVQTETQYMFIYTCLNDIIENPIEDDKNDKVADPIYENVQQCRKLIEEEN